MNKTIIKSLISRTSMLVVVLLFNIIFSGLALAYSEKDVVLQEFNQYYKEIYNARSYNKYNKIIIKHGSRNIVNMVIPDKADKSVLNLSFIKLVKPLFIPMYELEFESFSTYENTAKIVYHNKYNKNKKLYVNAIKENTEWKFDKSYIITKDDKNNIDESQSVSF